jgi:hypothetical protein
MAFDRVTSNNSAANLVTSKNRELSIRRIPYPYRAMLAICSDLDETPNREVYFEIMKFLNTTENTAMGPGIGLEVGNTIYFDMPPDQFSYWNTDEKGREMIRTLIRSGHIDCLHSYGDLATTRAHAERALEELSKYGCKLDVWADHAFAPSNFGADIMKGLGDVPDSDVYHADLTCGFGIKHIWRGRITSVIGQDAPRSLRGIYNRNHPMDSARTITKEFVKGVIARAGSVKYAMHGPNEVLRKVKLRDGHEVWEFIRSNPYWGGVENNATAEGLSDVINEQMLNELVERRGVCILYTHLGKIRDPKKPFGPGTRNALSLLAKYASEYKILVTTTSRLLDYCRLVREVTFSVAKEGECDKISVNVNGLETDVSGLSFYVLEPHKTKVFLNVREVSTLKGNDPDDTGQRSVFLPWTALEFPDL